MYANTQSNTEKNDNSMAKQYRVCGTYGCTLKDNHSGLHRIRPLKKRRSVDFFDNKKHATIPELLMFQCVDERNDILIEDPWEDYLRTGTLSPPPSPHPMKQPYVGTAKQSDPKTLKVVSPRSESESSESSESSICRKVSTTSSQ